MRRVAHEVILVNGLPGSGKTTLARALAADLGVALVSKDVFKEALASEDMSGADGRTLGAMAMGMVWDAAAAQEATVVIESWWFRPRDLGHARLGLARTGARAVLELWCEVPAEVARARYERRERHPVHQDAKRLAEDWADWVARGEPLGLGPVLRVDTGGEVDVPALGAAARASLARAAGDLRE